MNEVQKPTERRGYRLFRCIARPDDGLLENLLNAETGECRARGENPFVGVTNQNRRERPERHLMRLEDIKAYGLESESVHYGKSDPTLNLEENGATEEEIKSAAMASEVVQKFLEGKEPRKVIV